MPKRNVEENDPSTKCDSNSSKLICSSNHPSLINDDKSNKESTILTEEIDQDECGKSGSSCEKAVSFLCNSTEIGNDAELELDIQRPIDKNDVD